MFLLVSRCVQGVANLVVFGRIPPPEARAEGDVPGGTRGRGVDFSLGGGFFPGAGFTEGLRILCARRLCVGYITYMFCASRRVPPGSQPRHAQAHVPSWRDVPLAY